MRRRDADAAENPKAVGFVMQRTKTSLISERCDASTAFKLIVEESESLVTEEL